MAVMSPRKTRPTTQKSSPRLRKEFVRDASPTWSPDA